MRKFAILACLAALAAPIAAKDSLGVYSNWAAFRDADTPRCYAIAKPRGNNAAGAYASVGTWPKRNIRNQVHFRLSRSVGSDVAVSLQLGGERYRLAASGNNAWAANSTDEAAIIAALRSAESMRIVGRGFSDRYSLDGVATAMDAATVGCANI